MIALIGIALAAYDTFKAIRERDLKGKQRLLNYWVLVTLVGLVEPFGAKMVSLIIPGFFLLRAVFQFFFYIPSGFSFAVQGDMIQAFDRRLKEAEHHARANLFPFANEYKTKILDSVVLKSSFLLIFLTQVFVSSVSSEKLEQLEVNCLNILKLIRKENISRLKRGEPLATTSFDESLSSGQNENENMKMNAKLQKSSRRKTIVISSIFGENSFFSSTSKNKSGSASVCEPTDDVSIPSASPSKFNQEVDTATPTAFDSMVTTRRRSARSK